MKAVKTSLLMSMSTDHPISNECASKYIRHKEEILAYFYQIIRSHSELDTLLGDCPTQVFSDKLRYHIALMASVSLMGDLSPLERMLPWDYRTYHNSGIDYDYFPLEFACWKEAISKVLSKECAHAYLLIYDAMIADHDQCIVLSQQKPEMASVSTPEAETMQSRLLTMLLEGDHQRFTRLSLSESKTWEELFDFFVDVLQPTMERVGLLWEQGEISPAQEHMATAIVTKTLSHIFNTLDLPIPDKGKAIVTAAPNEYHEIGASMIASALESDGWEVIYFGANTPATALIEILRGQRPDILAISAVVPFNLEVMHDMIGRIRADRTLDGLKIMIGGRAFDTYPEIAHAMGADAYLKDIHEAIDKARQWLSEK